MFTLSRNSTKKEHARATWKHLHDEYRYLRVLRVLSLGAAGIFAGLLLWIVFFSYEHIYLTIGRVHNILFLKASASVEVIDFQGFDRAQAAWESRTTKENLSIPASSPFDDILTITPTTTAKDSVSL
jgi:hypothetical protein